MEIDGFIKLLPCKLTEKQKKDLLYSDLISKTITVGARQYGMSTVMYILIMFNMFKGGNSILFTNNYQQGEGFITNMAKLYYAMKPFTTLRFQKRSVIGNNSRLDLCSMNNIDQLRGMTTSYAYIDNADLRRVDDIMEIYYALKTIPIKINVTNDSARLNLIKPYIEDNKFSLTDTNILLG